MSGKTTDLLGTVDLRRSPSFLIPLARRLSVTAFSQELTGIESKEVSSKTKISTEQICFRKWEDKQIVERIQFYLDVI